MNGDSLADLIVRAWRASPGEQPTRVHALTSLRVPTRGDVFHAAPTAWTSRRLKTSSARRSSSRCSGAGPCPRGAWSCSDRGATRASPSTRAAASRARTIEFSGCEWLVTDSPDTVQAPGPNYWDGSQQGVWVDSTDESLHLTLRLDTTQPSPRWLCSQIHTLLTSDFGVHWLTLDDTVRIQRTGVGLGGEFVRLDKLLDANVNLVFGFFLYRSDKLEIDIEFSHLGQTQPSCSLNHDPGETSCNAL